MVLFKTFNYFTIKQWLEKSKKKKNEHKLVWENLFSLVWKQLNLFKLDKLDRSDSKILFISCLLIHQYQQSHNETNNNKSENIFSYSNAANAHHHCYFFLSLSWFIQVLICGCFNYLSFFFFFLAISTIFHQQVVLHLTQFGWNLLV